MVLLVASPALQSPWHAEMPSLLSAVRIQTASSSSAAALVLGTLVELYAEDLLRHSSPPLGITRRSGEREDGITISRQSSFLVGAPDTYIV